MALPVDSALFSVSGRIACVTGASRGLGRLSADFLVRAGARVVGVARDQDGLEEWRRSAGANAAVVIADLSRLVRSESFAAEIADRICTPFGAPEILVNAAGINVRKPAELITATSWNNTLDLNLSAPFFLAQRLVRSMRQSGWGRIVNFASLQSQRAFTDGIAYGASKGGVAQLTRAMAEAWSRDGVLVNALAPGFFHTRLTAPVFADRARAESLADATCIGRNGEDADLEGPLLFLCSDACRYVTGQLLFVDGGYTAR